MCSSSESERVADSARNEVGAMGNEVRIGRRCRDPVYHQARILSVRGDDTVEGTRGRPELDLQIVCNRWNLDDRRFGIAAQKGRLPIGAQHGEFGIGDPCGAQRVDATTGAASVWPDALIDHDEPFRRQLRRPRGVDLRSDLDQSRRGGQFESCKLLTGQIAERTGNS